MSEWKEYKLGDIVDVAQGLAINAKTKHLLSDSGLPLLRITDLINNTQVQFVKKDLAPKQTIALEEDIIYTRTGQVGLVFKGKVGVIHNNCFKVIPKDNKVTRNYIYWFLRQSVIKELANSIASGSVQKDLNHSAFKSININVPEIRTQNSISEVLSSLDDRIELNYKINQELESLAQLLFKRWFVDFEFPNEKGEPYKSSGGAMVDSELGEIPKGWEVKKLNEIGYCYDNKRIPLSSMERDKRKGIYPYYGAASLMDYVDDFLFEGVYVLMGEDGSVINEAGYPVLQYVFGKFWVNNHAHVLKGNIVSTEFILCLLRNTNISDLVTGAVQPKLNQGNMNKISVALPNDLTQITSFEESLMNFYNTIRCNLSEIQNLVNLRDSLLPKLISGELQIKEN